MLMPRSRRTLTGSCAIVFYIIAFILITMAMFTRSWLAAEGKAYGTAMDRIGLWVQCFRSITVPEDDLKERFFTGCRWIFDPFTTGYEDVRGMMQAPFFVMVQIFFSICFTLTLVGAALIGILVLCPGEEFEPTILKFAYLGNFVSCFFGFMAVIIFSIWGTSKDWMPHWEHNTLSWSFAYGVVGVVSQFTAGFLFFIESKIQKRKELVRENHGMVPMEARV